MQAQPDNIFDFTICSPPYEVARTYGIDFKLSGEAWVEWMLERTLEMVRVTKGLVVVVCEGRTRRFRWSATPALLMADLHRHGVTLRKPAAFVRNGIPGSGGPDWWRNDYEFCICCTSGGKLPWSDNTATGHPPKYQSGGACTHRDTSGTRVSQKRKKPGKYAKPKLSNPGNIVRCNVGGGHMGSKLAHLNEAPFPESLVEPFVKCFCPPGGIVFDPFGGSGTSAAVANKLGRLAVSCDLRKDQVDLMALRLMGDEDE